MAGKHITPPQKKQAITLRAAGYTIATISDKTNMSVSSLKRFFKEYSVKRGELKKKVISKATDELMNDATTIEAIKKEAASLILDDLAMVKRLRVAMAVATEVLDATDTAEALQVMRAVSAGAVALKSTSETLRKSLGLDKNDDVIGELPELVISIMTEQEIRAVRDHSASMSAGLDDGLGGLLPDGEDDVVSEGFDEPDVASA